MTLDEVRGHLQRALDMAALFARMTPTLKDDQAVALLRHIVADDVIFDGLEELLAKSPPPE